jgi:hypothetical protein
LILFLLKDFCNIYFRHAIPRDGFWKNYFRHAIPSEGFWKNYFRHAISSEGFWKNYFRHAIPSEGFCKIYYRHAVRAEVSVKFIFTTRLRAEASATCKMMHKGLKNGMIIHLHIYFQFRPMIFRFPGLLRLAANARTACRSSVRQAVY